MTKSECSDTLIVFRDYILQKDTLYFKPDQNGICSIPDIGNYLLTTTSQTHITFSVGPVPLKLDNFQLNIDTLHSTDLYQVLIIHSSDRKANKYENWQFCGHPADGKLVDYTINGYTQGQFRKGRAVGEIKSYNTEGELIFIAFYNKKGKQIKNDRTQELLRQIKK